VIDENRLMVINAEHFDLLKRLIMRYRNHPSVFIWSLGNEEWAIESNILGARIASTMREYARKLDSSRLVTTAISGGCGNGTSKALDVMGFNYLRQCDIDEYHKKFPDQPCMLTEETTSRGTRGVYQDDIPNAHVEATDRKYSGVSIETGWSFCADRRFLSGIFLWTGFDYRGEPNPLGWPQVGSQCGIVDLCGFPKDMFHYLKSWWTDEPVLHLLPHWNWSGKEGETISIWAYSNCDEVELFLNKKSSGRKIVPKYKQYT
jgi:beta-galactosidase